jgi:ribosome-binding factor A
LIRNELGRILLAKMSDPRVNPAITSITRVEAPEDLLTARVFVSVAADEKTQRRTVHALRHAAGYLQEAMAKRVRLRHTPKLEFEVDLKFKKTVDVLNLISEVSEEIRQKDRQREASDASTRER